MTDGGAVGFRPVTEGWRLPGDDTPLTGQRAAELIRQRVERGLSETWLQHDQGPLLAVISNGTRALVMLLDEPDDVGMHAVDPVATGRENGYILANGQHDTYDNRDTLPLGEALRVAQHIVEQGRPPANTTWQADR
ncbi:MAG: hypothetical protein JWQ95_4054 [Sphaerisporangium sp.]|nr:hypothetical protein [Sphaerisporangium sp.]